MSPATSTVYTATARGEGGDATASASVAVAEPAPVVVAPVELLRTAHASIVGPDGGFITDLGAGQFTITEDGIRREIVSVTFESEGQTSGIALVLDKSASLGSAIRDLKRAAVAFVEQKKPEDQILAMAFSSDVVTLRNFDTDRDAICASIRRLESSGNTRLYDALFLASEKIGMVVQPRIVVLMTDGVDEGGFGARGSTHTLEQAIERAKLTGVTVYTIGLGQKFDRSILERIATETNGHAYFTTDPTQLQEIYRKLSIGLFRGQYKIVYRSTPGASGQATVGSLSGRVVGRN